jgi:drug/metabolite transporter (DMT)-like permease
MSTAGKNAGAHDHQPMTAGQWGELLFLSGIWSTSFFLMKIADSGLPPLTLVLGRAASAAVTLYIFLHVKKLSLPRDPALWKQIALLALVNNVIPFSLIFWSETIIPSGIAGVLNAAVPIFTVLLAHYYLHQPATPAKLSGAALGMAGVALLIGWHPVAAPGAVWAELAVVLASLCYAIASIYAKRFNHLPSAVTAAAQLTMTTAMMIPISFFFDRPWHLHLPGWQPVAAVLALGVFCTALAYLLYFRILKTAGSLNITLVTFLMPVGALVLGVAFLHEEIHLSVLAGLGLIAGGLACIDGRLLRLFGRKKTAAQG